MRTYVLLAALLAPGLVAAATPVYRYVDKDGVTHYTDKPPTPDAKPANLPPLQTIGPGVSGPSDASNDAGSAAPGPRVNIAITSPAGDETLRGDDHTVPVSVRLDPELAPDWGLSYLLDGSAQNSRPTTATSYTLTNVERGEHLIAVAVVDGVGREIARSAPVIVHMKPPSVDHAPTPPGRPTPPKPPSAPRPRTGPQ